MTDPRPIGDSAVFHRFVDGLLAEAVALTGTDMPQDTQDKLRRFIVLDLLAGMPIAGSA